ncbi:hypothetical protein [Rouxiella badensis]|uniref:hypothetical protein n=1 Tax=Rouxiella badensis TaxID=1646377 RepID=UPI00301B6F51
MNESKQMEELKGMIDALQRRRLGFKKQIEEFKSLQGEIGQIYQNADSCPIAMSKLKKLSDVMTKGDKPLHQPMVEKVAVVKKTFDELGRQLKQLIPEEKVGVSAAKKSAASSLNAEVKAETAAEKPARAPIAKKHRRSFA